MARIKQIWLKKLVMHRLYTNYFELFQDCFETGWVQWTEWSTCTDDCLHAESNGTRTRSRYHKEEQEIQDQTEKCENICIQPKSATVKLSVTGFYRSFFRIFN